MRYPLYDLSWQEFENIVISICEEILGTGTIKFADGKDGGRDAKFTGTANNFPSSASPWNGKFIIQAKHTTNMIASCSDSEFNTLLKKEVEKLEAEISKLEELLDHDQNELTKATNKGDNNKSIELLKNINKYEKDIETKFSALEISQTKLDEMNKEFEKRMNEV